MILALSLAALFLINNVVLVYAYESTEFIPFDAEVVVMDENGNSYIVNTDAINTTVTQINKTRTNNGNIQDYMAEVSVLVPRASTNDNGRATGSITQDRDYDSTIAATVTIYFSTKDYSDGSTGVLLTSFSSRFSLVDDSVIVNRIVTTYDCQGQMTDYNLAGNTSQTGTITRWDNFSYSTGFTKYVLSGGLGFIVGAKAVYHCEDRLSSWTTTITCRFP